MRPVIPALLACSLALGCSGNSDFYMRFESVGPLPSANSGTVTQVVGFGSQYFSVSGSELQLIGGPLPVKVTDAVAAAVLGDSLFIASPAGGIARSTDGESFEAVSAEKLERLVTVGEALVGLRRVGLGHMAVLRSTDRGVTWKVLAEDVGLDEQIEQGSDVYSVAGATHELAWLSVAGDGNLEANFASVGRVFEIRGEAVTPLSREQSAVFPAAVGSDGTVVLDVLSRWNSLNQPTDRLPVALASSFSPGMDWEGLPLLHYVSVPFLEVRPDTRVFGADGEGRLMMSLGDTLVRSAKPLTRGNDMRGEILAGPGCDGRNSFKTEPSGDSVKLTVKNESNTPVLIRAIDSQYRWSPISEVPAGETRELTGFSLRAGYYVMATDARETCLAARQVPEDGGELTVPKR